MHFNGQKIIDSIARKIYGKFSNKKTKTIFFCCLEGIENFLNSDSNCLKMMSKTSNITDQFINRNYNSQ